MRADLVAQARVVRAADRGAGLEHARAPAHTRPSARAIAYSSCAPSSTETPPTPLHAGPGRAMGDVMSTWLRVGRSHGASSGSSSGAHALVATTTWRQRSVVGAAPSAVSTASSISRPRVRSRAPRRPMLGHARGRAQRRARRAQRGGHLGRKELRASAKTVAPRKKAREPRYSRTRRRSSSCCRLVPLERRERGLRIDRGSVAPPRPAPRVGAAARARRRRAREVALHVVLVDEAEQVLDRARSNASVGLAHRWPPLRPVAPPATPRASSTTHSSSGRSSRR